MGLIESAIQLGFEDDHLISVVPPFAAFKSNDEITDADGKQPGVPYLDGLWGPIKGSWTKVQNKNMRAQADKEGCNVGLRLALPCAAFNDTKIVAIDIDLANVGDGIAETKLCDLLERKLAEMMSSQSHENQQKRYVVWVRKTVSYRATLLVRIPADATHPYNYVLPFIIPHQKHKPLLLDEPANKQPLKERELKHTIEFLSGYTVIAGMHKSRTKIEWYRSDYPDKRFDLPMLSEDSLPLFSSWDMMVDCCTEVIEGVMLNPNCPVLGLKPVPSIRTVATEHSDTPPPHSELVPPSPSALIRLIRDMPNPVSVTRPQYMRVVMAIAGARHALLRSKNLTLDEDEEILDAAAEWVVRHEGGAYDFDKERDKLEADIFRKDIYRSGWRVLVSIAEGLNVDVSSYKMDDAQDLFTADTPTKSEFLWQSNPEHIVSNRIEYSEFWFATEFSKHAQGRLKWVPEMKTWIAFTDEKGGWFANSGTHWMREQIQVFLTHLVENTPAIPREEVKSILSSYKINAIERILQDRMVQERETLNDAPWFLQTKAGAYDLRTGEKIDRFQQMTNLDLRYTAVAPKAGSMTLWNSVIYHLCDDNHDTAEWLKFYLAYSLIGSPTAHKMVFLHGQGMNGKSTLLSVMSGILGSYAGMIERDVWLEKGADKHPASLYRIRDVRFAYTSEMPPSAEWNESRLKAVSGQDDIEARVMHGNPVVFKARAALVMVGQTIPVFRKVDTSISRRMAIIGTTRMPRVPIPHLSDIIIRDEGSAILYDLMERAKMLWALGEKLPEMSSAMVEELKEYLDQTDTMYAWATSECIMGADAGEEPIEIALLHKRYQAFLKRTNSGDDDVLAQMDNGIDRAFMAGLRRLGARTKGPDGKPLQGMVCGIRLKVGLVKAA